MIVFFRDSNIEKTYREYYKFVKHEALRYIHPDVVKGIKALDDMEVAINLLRQFHNDLSYIESKAIVTDMWDHKK